MTDVEMETVSWLVASGYRLDTCDVLSDSLATPTGVASEADMEVTHASRSISQLQDRGLVELMSDEDQRKGRIYALTDKGEVAYEQAQQVKR